MEMISHAVILSHNVPLLTRRKFATSKKNSLKN